MQIVTNKDPKKDSRNRGGKSTGATWVGIIDCLKWAVVLDFKFGSLNQQWPYLDEQVECQVLR